MNTMMHHTHTQTEHSHQSHTHTRTPAHIINSPLVHITLTITCTHTLSNKTHIPIDPPAPPPSTSPSSYHILLSIDNYRPYIHRNMARLTFWCSGLKSEDVRMGSW